MTEKWYGTKYIIEDIPNVDIQRWSEANLNPAFALPPKNEFIPADFAIAPLSAKHSTIPTSVKVRFSNRVVSTFCIAGPFFSLFCNFLQNTQLYLLQ